MSSRKCNQKCSNETVDIRIEKPKIEMRDTKRLLGRLYFDDERMEQKHAFENRSKKREAAAELELKKIMLMMDMMTAWFGQATEKITPKNFLMGSAAAPSLRHLRPRHVWDSSTSASDLRSVWYNRVNQTDQNRAKKV